MAPIASFSDDSRIIKRTLPKSLLLRDYLLDDMSSCSSNGFRSYPRRQCCNAAVRFLVEADLSKNVKQLPSNHHRRLNIESRINRTSSFKPKQSSILQKASGVVIKVFKHLKHGFWKKHDRRHNNEVKRLKSFADLLNEKEITPPLSPSASPVSTAVPIAAAAELTSSTSNSNSWSDSDFTAATGSFTAGNYEVNLAQNDIVDESPEDKKLTNGNRVGTTTATATVPVNNDSDSTGNATWLDKHDEQFSPVSVMDFPTENNIDHDVKDEDEVSSVSQHKRLAVKGTKTSMYKRVPQLEPVKLEDRIAQSVVESSSKENKIEKKATELLQLMKSTFSTPHSSEYDVVERVLLGFFKESAIEEKVSDNEMIKRAKDWMEGQEQEQEMFIDWDCESNRETYLRDMEKCVKWSNYDHELEKVNVGLEMEFEIFKSLVNDVLTDLNLQEF
ncbi:hypothetical protein E3N88_24882 [Mikania micrantha]|uniref:DUF4378 domain-containing protein n=1 Tax=Mikania micrantha TaxID=192012 RepID=A0A5N6N3E5_9ASTR|nr:hypothetical protein E3N88_24882 [Mikania micrantha]